MVFEKFPHQTLLACRHTMCLHFAGGASIQIVMLYACLETLFVSVAMLLFSEDACILVGPLLCKYMRVY